MRISEDFQQATAAQLGGWGATVGTRRVSAAELEHEFKLKAGKISKGAGIESVARVADGEDELTLGMRASEAALACGDAGIEDVDCIIATSETHLGFPSLGARLHAGLLADERCAVLDVGGGCLGLVNALAVARALFAAGRYKGILIVTADVHSRLLSPARVRGEFGALFGDGASAFVLRPSSQDNAKRYRVNDVILGCNAAAASAIGLRWTEGNGIDLTFQGEALSRAALARLELLIEDLELRSGISRKKVAAFATHQPNPRLLQVLARQLKVPAEKFPPVARTCGNLGSSTCGAALSHALAHGAERGDGGPIFVASLGPGLLFGGLVLS